MRSTDVERTMQSGYSELMGLYHPGNGSESTKLSAAQTAQMQYSGIGLPPFNLRNAGKVNTKLGNNALPDSYVGVPIYTDSNPTMFDDLDLTGCDYVNAVDGYRFPANSTYYPVDWLYTDQRAPLGICFNLTSEEEWEMDFMALYGYGDDITSRLFEGLDIYCELTDAILTQIN